MATMVVSDIYVLIQERALYYIGCFQKQYTSFLKPVPSYYEIEEVYSKKLLLDTEDFEKAFDFMLQMSLGGKVQRGLGAVGFYFDMPIGEQDKADVQHAMIFFNPDGTVLLGIGVAQDVEAIYIKEMQDKFNEDLIVCYFVPPPRTKAAFLEHVHGKN